MQEDLGSLIWKFRADRQSFLNDLKQMETDAAATADRIGKMFAGIGGMGQGANGATGSGTGATGSGATGSGPIPVQAVPVVPAYRVPAQMTPGGGGYTVGATGFGVTQPTVQSPGAGGGGGGGAGGSGNLIQSLGLQNIIKTSIVTAIVKTIANEIENESNFKKANAMAGANGHLRGQLEVDRVRGSVGAIPFIGPAMNSILSPYYNSVELGIQQNIRDERLNDAGRELGVRQIGQRYSTSIAQTSSLGFVSRMAGVRSAGTMRMSQLQEQYAKEQSDLPLEDTMKRKSIWGGGRRAWMDWLGTDDDAIVGYKSDNGAIDRNNRLTSNLASKYATSFRLAKEQSAADKAVAIQEGMFDVTVSGAEIERQQFQNRLRPYAGEAAYVSKTAIGQAKLMGTQLAGIKDKSSPEYQIQKDMMINNLTQSVEQLKGAQKDIYLNQFYGRPMQFDPRSQAIEAMRDISPETPGQANDALTKAIENLTLEIKNLKTQK